MKVFDDIKSPLDDFVGLLYIPGANGLGDAVFSARRRSPDELEIVRGKGALIVPAQDVAVDVGG
jgi:hypothetical protein